MGFYIMNSYAQAKLPLNSIMQMCYSIYIHTFHSLDPKSVKMTVEKHDEKGKMEMAGSS
jgi:hypothetical protein